VGRLQAHLNLAGGFGDRSLLQNRLAFHSARSLSPLGYAPIKAIGIMQLM
jgi:hypothetical protein